MSFSLTGQTLGEFEIRDELGRGGMAITYRAWQPTMERFVAVKVIQPQLADDAGFVARFLQEVKIIARLEHPRILPVYVAGQTNGTVYLVMRLVEGGTLRDLIRRGTPAPTEVNRFIGQLASALNYAHQQEVLHLDLKPSNVLIDLTGEAYLADFGIARVMTPDGQHRPEMPLGTPEYMSPEQCAGYALDARSDVYALGVVLYELLAGRVPYRGETAEATLRAHLSEALPLPPHLSPQLHTVLLRALAKRKEERFPSCVALAESLTATLAGLPMPVYASPFHDDQSPTLVDEPVAAESGTTLQPSSSAATAPTQGKPKRDATWFCGLCGTALVGRLEGEPCPTCNSTRALQKPR